MRHTSSAKRLGGRKSEKSDACKECASSARWMILFERISSSQCEVFPNDWSQFKRDSHSSRQARVALLGGYLMRLNGVNGEDSSCWSKVESACRSLSDRRARMRW